MRTGTTPIWNTVCSSTKSSSVRSNSGAPNARSAAITLLAFSGVGRIHMSIHATANAPTTMSSTPAVESTDKISAKSGFIRNAE